MRGPADPFSAKRERGYVTAQQVAVGLGAHCSTTLRTQASLPASAVAQATVAQLGERRLSVQEKLRRPRRRGCTPAQQRGASRGGGVPREGERRVLG